MTTGQRDSILFTLKSRDQFMAWNGVAGSGKTTALIEVKKFAESHGKNMIALAPDGSSAKVLGDQMNIRSKTIHSFLKSKTVVNSETILIVDEAGKMSTRLAKDLTESAQKSGCRVVFTGDEKQLGSVEAGNPFRAMITNGVATTVLSEHRRQKNQSLKEVVESLSKATFPDIKDGIDRLRDRITERKTRESRHNFVVKKYMNIGPEQRNEVLLLADTNKDRRDLTERVRESLRKEGTIGERDYKIPVLEARDLSLAEKRGAENYRNGDILVTNSMVSPLKRDVHYTVEGKRKDGLYVAHGTKNLWVNTKNIDVTVYEKRELEVAKGDLLEWRKNKDGLTNREELSVVRVDDRQLILKDSRKQIYKLSTDKSHHLDHGIVKTTYSAQGSTKDKVIALAGSNISKESLYVLSSRARYNVEIVTDSKEKLIKRATRSSAKENALDHIDFEPAKLEFDRGGKSISLEKTNLKKMSI